MNTLRIRKLLQLNSVVISQFSYCPLIWMFNSRYLNNALNSIHERVLNLIYNDYEFPLNKNKFQVDLTPPFMNDLFVIRENNEWPICHQGKQWMTYLSSGKTMNDLFVIRENKYNLGNFQAVESLHKWTVKFRKEIISYRGPQLWNLIPERLRTLATWRVVSATFLLVCFLSINESTFQTRKSVLVHFKSSFHSRENQILKFYILKFIDVIKFRSIKQEIHVTE